ncbi:MAG: hypothetical protein ACM33T_02210 [Solirubrobacterales bacterium]
MRKRMLAGVAAVVGLTAAGLASPASAGKIACQHDVRRIVHYARGDLGNSGVVLTREQREKLAVATAQCSFADGQANANIVALRAELGMRGPGPQAAFDPLFVDDPHAFD